VTRRQASAVLFLLPPGFARASERATVSGRLHPTTSTVSIQTANGRTVELLADKSTAAVLRDARIASEEFEARGQWESASRFRIDPIHTKALFIRRGGKPLVITYWCEVCAIRTYAPGRCQCCQEDTAFDPRDPALDNNSL
jgi:hypothetical protein